MSETDRSYKAYLQGLAASLREHRKRKKLTMAETAEKLGVPLSTYQHWENGRSQPSLELLPKLAALHGITLEELLGVELESEAALLKQKLDRLAPATKASFLALLDSFIADQAKKK